MYPCRRAVHVRFTNYFPAKLIGAEWKNECDEIEQYFAKLAQFIKEKHAKDFPDYSYKHRKPAEKKRRMTPKKAAKLNSLAQTLRAKNDMPEEFQANEVEVADPTQVSSAPLEVESIELASIEDFNDVPLAGVQDPLPEMNYVDSNQFLLSCPEFSFGNPNVNPETLQAMLEAHNEQYAGNPGFGTFQVANTNPVIESTNEGDLFSEEFGALNTTFDWAKFNNDLQTIDDSMSEEYLRFFADMNDVTSGQGRINIHDKFPDPAAEVYRQQRLLQPYMLEN